MCIHKLYFTEINTLAKLFYFVYFLHKIVFFYNVSIEMCSNVLLSYKKKNWIYTLNSIIFMVKEGGRRDNVAKQIKNGPLLLCGSKTISFPWIPNPHFCFFPSLFFVLFISNFLCHKKTQPRGKIKQNLQKAMVSNYSHYF